MMRARLAAATAATLLAACGPAPRGSIAVRAEIAPNSDVPAVAFTFTPIAEHNCEALLGADLTSLDGESGPPPLQILPVAASPVTHVFGAVPADVAVAVLGIAADVDADLPDDDSFGAEAALVEQHDLGRDCKTERTTENGIAFASLFLP
jgi:hypothetical protein